MDENNQTGAPSPDEAKKQLKKQAKREAKAMQALEQAQKDLKKAEQKLARATQNLQKRQAQVDASLEKLEKIRSASPREAQSPESSHASEIEVINRPETLAESVQNEAILNEAIEEFVEEVLEEAESLQQADENATRDLPEVSTEELLDLGILPQTDENATRDLELVELETAEPAVEEDLAVDLVLPVEEILGENAPQAAETKQEEAAPSETTKTKRPARNSKTPTSTTGTRRSRTSSTSSTSQSGTRRRAPSSRAKSNGTQKAGEGENA